MLLGGLIVFVFFLFISQCHLYQENKSFRQIILNTQVKFGTLLDEQKRYIDENFFKNTELN